MQRNHLFQSRPYPDNLLVYAHLDDCLPLTDEQETGLEFVLSKMPSKYRKVVKLYFEEHMTEAQVGSVLGVSGSRIGYLIRQAARFLRKEENREWIEEGYTVYRKFLCKKQQKEQERQVYMKSNPKEIRIQEAGFVGRAERAFIGAGLKTVGDVVELIQQNDYFRRLKSYGPATDLRVRERLKELGVKN